MPTDPVQVVAEARCVVLDEPFCNRDHGRGWLHPECAVAALKAAGALMPEEAERLRGNGMAVAEFDSTYIVRLTRAEALLQEALSVLGRHTSEPHSTGEFCDVSGEHWPCPEASLAEKIEKATGGEG